MFIRELANLLRDSQLVWMLIGIGQSILVRSVRWYEETSYKLNRYQLMLHPQSGIAGSNRVIFHIVALAGFASSHAIFEANDVPRTMLMRPYKNNAINAYYIRVITRCLFLPCRFVFMFCSALNQSVDKYTACFT